MSTIRIEIWQRPGPFWDVYFNNHFVSRYGKLYMAKRHAMATAGTDCGHWHKKNKGSLYPLRYWFEETA